MERGTVVLVGLDPTLGHEQRGTRPCVVISDPLVLNTQRFPLVGVVPLTSTPGEGALYPALEPGPSGLRHRSWALIDHVRAVDKQRILGRFGVLAAPELASIDLGLRLFLGL